MIKRATKRTYHIVETDNSNHKTNVNLLTSPTKSHSLSARLLETDLKKNSKTERNNPP